jgi:hypothetical protein
MSSSSKRFGKKELSDEEKEMECKFSKKIVFFCSASGNTDAFLNNIPQSIDSEDACI